MLTMTQPIAAIPPHALGLATEPPAAVVAAIRIRLPNGLPGFPGETDYLLEPVAATEGRFFRLRTADSAGPGFLLTAEAAPAQLVDAHEVELAAVAAGLDPDDVVALFVVAAAHEYGSLQLFVNRRAPVLIDVRRHLAIQVVLTRPDYAVRHHLGAFGKPD